MWLHLGAVGRPGFWVSRAVPPRERQPLRDGEWKSLNPSGSAPDSWEKEQPPGAPPKAPYGYKTREHWGWEKQTGRRHTSCLSLERGGRRMGGHLGTPQMTEAVLQPGSLLLRDEYEGRASGTDLAASQKTRVWEPHGDAEFSVIYEWGCL